MSKGLFIKFLVCVFFLLLLIPLSIFTGYETISPFRLWQEIWQNSENNSRLAVEIVLYHRIPRTLIAILVGAGLSIGGVTFQALLRNPLATPYTLGTSSFASLGAYIAYLGMNSFLSSLFPAIPIPLSHLFAFVFAMGEVFLILILIRTKPRLSATILLLCGITLGMLANAIIAILRYWATPDKLVLMERWWFGSTQVLGYRSLTLIFLVSLPAFLILWFYSYALDQYTFDTEIAQSRGINITKLQINLFITVSILTAIIVAETGPIGFVGLIVPHITHYWVGSAHTRVFPFSAMVGGTFLLFCDILSRKLLGSEIPVGIITTLIGVPAFLYILFGKNFKEWMM